MSNESPLGVVLFDRSTGAVLATHAIFDMTTQSYRAPTQDEAWEMFNSALGGRSKEQVDVLVTNLPRDAPACCVDVANRELVPKHALQISAARTELRGDGQDSVAIDIRLVDAAGHLQVNNNANLRVTTTRGRLSSPGGRIQLNQGKASITLTSVAETVAEVIVTVRDEQSCCMPASLSVEFI
jgi:hypothetical protein